MRKVSSKDARNRFLYHIPWLVVRAGMSWERWGRLHENVAKCDKWFDEDPCWMRSYQVWRLIHQMAGYTGDPELIELRDVWLKKMSELDEGEKSDRESAGKLVSYMQAGLTATELKRIRKLCKNKTNWRYNPSALQVIKQVDGRFGKKTHRAA